MFIVFDMDGTLSDPAHRVHHLENKDWDAFYEACDGDTPHLHILYILELLQEANHKIEIWTGRRESTRQKTIDWLKLHGVQNVEIVMRSNDDRRHDTVTKGEWLDQRGRPDMVFEDRNSMVDFYRSKNIRCLQVAPGDF